jgi:dipeptidyl aminopeptidase/acylaminoacyl peptidase
MTSSTETVDPLSTGATASTTQTPTTDAPTAPLIPRTVLFGDPHRASPSLSLDGRRLAWLAPHDGVLNVWTRDLDGSDRERPVTSDTDRGVHTFVWAPDSAGILYLQDKAGDENWQLHHVHLDSGEEHVLTPAGAQARIAKTSRRHPDAMLIEINADNPQLHDVYRLELSTGQLTKVCDNPGFIAFVADEDLQVRAALAPRPDGGATIMVRDDAHGSWRPLLQVDHEDAMSTAPVAFNADGTRLLCITSHQANAAQLLWLEVATGAREVLAGDPLYDVSGVTLHPGTNQPQLAFVQRERLTPLVLDAVVADDITALTALGGDLDLLGRDDRDLRWLVATRHDDGPIRYHLYHRDTRQAEPLFTHQPDLEHYELASMEPFTCRSSDGLDLHGYLTFPPGRARQNLPTVLLVHGGPWYRDRWGFDPQAQLLANRGYLVIQPNFRGSTGYGKQFLNAGNGQWGARMHDDLLDAVAWAVGEGFADPDRVAIFGGSYGGYAALTGAAFTPEVFACAVAAAAPTNLVTLIRAIPPYWKPMIAQFHLRVGNPDTEEEFLRSHSPLFKAGDMTIPLLIVQGANDPRVPREESEQIVRALRERGVPPTYLLYPDEGHGLVQPANRLSFVAAAETFLAQHLGGRAEPVGDHRPPPDVPLAADDSNDTATATQATLPSRAG